MLRVLTILALALSLAAGPAGAQMAVPQVAVPYDRDLQRLSEILGALHFLRAICGSKEGQKWRNEAQTLIDPVRKPVIVLMMMRNAAASIDSRAAEFFAAAASRCAAAIRFFASTLVMLSGYAESRRPATSFIAYRQGRRGA